MSTALLQQTRHESSEFRSLGEFLTSVALDGLKLRHDPRLSAAAGSDEQHSGSQQFGGFTVPPQLVLPALRIAQDDALIGRLTRVRMTSSRAHVPARVDKNHSGSVAGGVTLARRPPTTTITSSRSEMERIALHAVDLSGLVYADEDLLSDSAGAMEAYLEAAFRDAMIAAIMQELVRGAGAGEGLGYVNSPATIAVSRAGGGAIAGADITGIAKRTWRYLESVWVSNPDCLEQLAGAHTAGTNSDRFYLEGDTEDSLRLLGRPLVLSEFAPALGSRGDLSCIVPSEVLYGVRTEKFQDSMHVRFEENERAIRFVWRGDIRPWWRSALTPESGAATLSAYTVLDA